MAGVVVALTLATVGVISSGKVAGKAVEAVAGKTDRLAEKLGKSPDDFVAALVAAAAYSAATFLGQKLKLRLLTEKLLATKSNKDFLKSMEMSSM